MLQKSKRSWSNCTGTDFFHIYAHMDVYQRGNYESRKSEIDENGKSQKTNPSKDRFFMFFYGSFNPGLQALLRIDF